MRDQDYANFNTFYNVPDNKSDSQRSSNGIRRIFILDDEEEHPNDVNFRDETAGFAINLKDRHIKHCEGTWKLRGADKTDIKTVPEEKSYQSSSCATLASSFFKDSSIYALSQIGNSNTMRRKIFWAFILIGGIIGCCSQVTRYLTAYYKYPVVININSVNIFNQDFPGVTICNMNNIRNTYLPCVLRKEDHQSCNVSDTPTPSLDYDGLDAMNPSLDYNFDESDTMNPAFDYNFDESDRMNPDFDFNFNYSNTMNPTSDNDYDYLNTINPSLDYNFDDSNNFDNSDTITPSSISLEDAVSWPQPDCFRQADPPFSDEFVQKMQFTSLYFSLTDESKIKFGHQAKDFIKSCSFNGEDCSYTDFTTHLDSTYGNCFTFNQANATKEPLKTSYIGPNSGLSLELNVESELYTWLTQSVGARAVIHDPYQQPTPDDQGINVSPGFETTLGLSKVMMRRLESPYKDHCKNYETGDSKRQCDSACSQRKIARYCSCSLKSTTNTRACDLSNLTDLCCVYLEGQLDREYNETCDCPLECVSSSYEMKISSGVWPASPLNLAAPLGLNIKDIKETALKLKIYFDTLEQLTYEQKPMFEESEVLSQIGGQMGLWLGLSLAAMFECLENIVLFWHYRNRKKT